MYTAIVSEKIGELIERYGAGNNYDIADVQDFFSKIPEHLLDEVMRAIVTNHEYNTFPKLIKIRKYLEKEQVYAGERNRKESYAYYTCQECKATFEASMGWCPLCKRSTRLESFISAKKISDAFAGRNGCEVCDKYSGSAICPTCNEWGKGIYSQVCNECQGLECCRENYSMISKKLGAGA